MFILHKGVYQSDLLNTNLIEHGFGTKDAHSANTSTENIRAVQTHSTHIAYVTDLSSMIYNDTDGLITALKGIALTVKTADCVPVMYSDFKNRVIGIAHMGWKGIINNLTDKMIRYMRDAGADSGSIKVAIGPSIGPCCYRLHGPRLEQFLQRWPIETTKTLVTHFNHTFINLAQFVYMQTCNSGIDKNLIDYRPFCTSCDISHFHSFQREKSGCEHMMSYISLLPDTI